MGSSYTPPGGGIGGTTGTTDNAITRANGTGGSTLQGSLATVDNAGNFTTPGFTAFDYAFIPGAAIWTNDGLRVGSDDYICWSSSANGQAAAGDTFLVRAAANTLALRNGANGQTWIVSRTFTNASNYSQVAHVLTSSTFAFTVQEAGTGVGSILRYSFDKPLGFKGYTVATLPSGTTGDNAYVTDALAPTFLATIVGGGAIVTPVFYNGSNWVGA